MVNRDELVDRPFAANGSDSSWCGTAPEKLGGYLRNLADQLAGTRPARRIRYGSSAVQLLRRRSPEGFLLDSDHGDLQLLLPDGRMWEYRGNSPTPGGRYFDACVDYVDFVHSRLRIDGIEFAYLGATIGKYSFVVATHDRVHRAPRSGSLCAVDSSAPSRIVEPSVAFAEIATGLLGAQSR